jgi:DNA-binding CsgD family transcriptional regulator
VDGHVRSIYMKLHVHNRGGAVAKAVREHLL